MTRKSQVWVSAILYMLIATIAMTLIIQAGLPILNNMKEKSIYSKTEDMLKVLDKHITDVVSEGKGSQRVVPIELLDGELIIDDGTMEWEFETETKIFEPKTRIHLGNLVITTNSDVTVREYGGSYILINNLIKVNITKIDGTDGWQAINTSLLINSLEFIATGKKTNGTFNFVVGDESSSSYGNGHTFLKETGTNLAYGSVVAHVNSSLYEYDLELTLESDADFIRVNVKNLIIK